MGMTMTQKILAAHAGLESVTAGQLIEADLDLVLGNDITSPVAIKEMEKMKAQGVFDKDKIALVPDHFVPNKDIHHTHEGSMGNLQNDAIKALMENTIRDFHFERVTEAENKLLGR